MTLFAVEMKTKKCLRTSTHDNYILSPIHLPVVCPELL